MTFSRLSTVLCTFALAATAHAQFQSSRPATKPPPVKPAAVKVHGGATSPQPSPQNGIAQLVGGNDDCATPDLIAGAGPFSVDTTAATTGTQGQTEAACVFFGTSAIDRDVWFQWTAPSTSLATLSMCAGTTGIDSKVAVYAAGGCPTASTALACNDDFCSLVSQVSWAATAGQSYLIQMGSFVGTVGYSSSFTITFAPAPPANDVCATPTAIAGVGTFAFDTGNAVGTVANGTCASPQNDVWFAWTAPVTTQMNLTLCGQASVDTVVAVWDSGVCPPTSLVACSDDFCGLQSELTFAATSGTTYLFELGSFSPAVTYAGTFTVSFVTPPNADECATPELLGPTGPYTFDNSAASTSTQGQDDAGCFFFSSTSFDHDLWFCWTAPSSGSFDVRTIGLTAVDTRLAVYQGCACPGPAPTSLGCNDDACGTLQSALTFNALAGASYLIHLGTFPGAAGGTGQFDITPSAPVSDCRIDDGTSEQSIGLTAGGRIVLLQSFGTAGERTLVTSVSAAYGTPAFPGGSVAPGTPVDVLVWDDPNDDGDPDDCVLVFQGAGVVGGSDADVFDTYPTTPSVLDGVFFVGVGLAHAAGQFPMSLDTSSCSTGTPAWAVGATSGPIDYAVLTNNQIPPLNISSIFGAVALLRAGCAESSGTSFCGNSDPNRLPCPCGNNGTNPEAGCANSLHADGALLSTTGFTPTDDVALIATSMSGQVCIFFATDLPSLPDGFHFGDGIACTGGSLVRLRSVAFALGSGTAQFPPNGSTLTLSDRSGTFPGAGVSRWYGAFYRNAAAFCTPATYNTTNTVRLDW